jgi:plasmid stabilization system protein ParE
MYKSIILPVAKQDIKEAAAWYNERQPGLGKRFTAYVRKTVHYIRQNPNAVAIRYDNIRTALLDTFPYMIHFSVDDDKKIITVLAVLHTARDPKIWEERKK